MPVKGGINRRDKLRSKVAITKANAKVESKISKSNVKLTKASLRSENCVTGFDDAYVHLEDIMLGRGDGDCIDAPEHFTNEKRKSERIIKIIENNESKEVNNAHLKNTPKKAKNNSSDECVKEVRKCRSKKKDDVKDVIMTDDANNLAGFVTSTGTRHSNVTVDSHAVRKHVTSTDRLTGLTQTPKETSDKKKIDIRKSMSFLEMMDYLTTPEFGDESDIDVSHEIKTEGKSKSPLKLKNKGSIRVDHEARVRKKPITGSVEEVIVTRGKSTSPIKKQQSPKKSTKEIIRRINSPGENKGSKIDGVEVKEINEIERRTPTPTKKKQSPSKSTEDMLVASNSPGKKKGRKPAVENAEKLNEDEKRTHTPSKKQQSPSKSATEKISRLNNPGVIGIVKSVVEDKELIGFDRKTEKCAKKEESPSKSTKEIFPWVNSPRKRDGRKSAVENAKKINEEERRAHTPSKKQHSPSKSATEKISQVNNSGIIGGVKSVVEEKELIEFDKKTEKCAKKQQSPPKSTKEILRGLNNPEKRYGRKTAVKNKKIISEDERRIDTPSKKKQSPSKSAKEKLIIPGEITHRKSADDKSEELIEIKEKPDKCTKKQSPPKSVINVCHESKNLLEIRLRKSAVGKAEEVINDGSKESPINERITHTTTKRTSPIKSASEMITEWNNMADKRRRKSAFVTAADDEIVDTSSKKLSSPIKSSSEITTESHNSSEIRARKSAVKKEDESIKGRSITQTSSQENTTMEIRGQKSVHNEPTQSPKIPGFALIEEIRSRKSAFPTKMTPVSRLTTNETTLHGLQRSSPYKRPLASLSIDEPRQKMSRLDASELTLSRRQAVTVNEVKEVKHINGGSLDSESGKVSVEEDTVDMTKLERQLTENIEKTKQELIKKRLASGTESRTPIIFTRGISSTVGKNDPRSKRGALKKSYRIKLTETNDVNDETSVEETEERECLSTDEESTMEADGEGVKKGWCSVM